ncbi:hypothetical protein LCGC14_0711040 [marine sediment metagenome]|uniref:Uncharacterized protein n=1 Tax=marine sediment metagenome TaxID=412755 RepID=A0A0F9R0F8_9ZZZZ
MKQILEPTQAPRGVDIIALEGRKRSISAARLDSYYVPRFNNSVAGYRQIPGQPAQRVLGPTSAVQEGLFDLVQSVEGADND